MLDNLNVIENPLLLGQNVHQFFLDYYGVIAVSQSQLVGDSLYMGIYDNAGLMKDVSPDYISCLSANTVKGGQLFNI